MSASDLALMSCLFSAVAAVASALNLFILSTFHGRIAALEARYISRR